VTDFREQALTEFEPEGLAQLNWEALAESELALTNLQRFDPVLKSGWRNSELGRRP